jgi:tetratricopeptide (TPR) repeat protein
MAAVSALAAPSKGVDNQRLQQIWHHVEDRMTDQSDIWFDAGDYLSAINILRFENKEAPADYEYATNLGWMLENVENYDQALVVYIRYRKDNAGIPDAPFPEANFYFSRKAYVKVPPLLQASIPQHPHPNSYRLLAHAYERLGLLPDALKVWKQLVSDHPEDDAAKVNLKKTENRLASQKTSR